MGPKIERKHSLREEGWVWGVRGGQVPSRTHRQVGTSQ